MTKARRLGALLAALMMLAASAAAESGKLRNGDAGAEVVSLQTALQSLGYPVGTVDGKFGTRTENAVRSFQRKYRLKVDGIAGSATLAKLFSLTGSAPQAAPAQAAPAQAQTPAAPAASGVPTRTLRSGSTGSDVVSLQSRLAALGYYTSGLDGRYGSGTKAAVTAFQQANGLTADGVAGSRTCARLYSAQAVARGAAAAQTAPVQTAAQTAPAQTAAVSYRLLSRGSTGAEVHQLQQALQALGYYAGSCDGVYGDGTAQAVRAFQTRNKLSADGIAGIKTQTALYSGSCAAADTSAAATASAPAQTTSGPAVSQVKLLHWYNEVKPSLRAGQHILVYDPATGCSWTLRLYSLGRHADAEPLTAADTASLERAFGGNTWNQKAVYVRLPSGTWVLGSTHSMPHLTGSVKDNNFNGHLCVHFLRDMDECRKMDPKYGVANQETIRAAWRSMTGQVVN